MKSLIVSACLFVGCCAMQLCAQETRGTINLIEGKKYVVAFPKVQSTGTEPAMNPAMMLFISSRTKTKINIRTLALSNTAPQINREYDIEPNKILQVPISTTYMNVDAGKKTGFGIQIEGIKPISVSTYQAWQGNGELARHLPIGAWGKQYRTMNLYLDRYGSPGTEVYRTAQILVIAQEDSTKIQLSSKVAFEKGVDLKQTSLPTDSLYRYEITLQRCESILLQPTVVTSLLKDWASDPSGTLITASAPIAMVSGHTKGAIMRYPNLLPPSGSYSMAASFVRSNIHDVMFPAEMAGTEFVTLPFKYTPTRTTGLDNSEYGIDDDIGDVIRIVALKDSTKVYELGPDGFTLFNLATLNAGESYRDTAREKPCVYKTSKPAMCGQYGKSYAKVLPPIIEKGGDRVEGHPTVESGMPSLTMVPPTDRWISYATFKSPEGMDNFFNIVFKVGNLGKIKVDGQSLQPTFEGKTKNIQGTSWQYIATEISPGDHVVESESEDVEFCAWTYGSLDGLQQGRAYATPVSIDLSVPCKDTIIVLDTLGCQGWSGLTTVQSQSAACGSLFEVYPEDLTNMEFVAQPMDDSSRCNWQLNITDKSKVATATIRFVSRSGKYVQRTYTVETDSVKTRWPSKNFGTIPFNTPHCDSIVITNSSQTKPLAVNNITAKYFPQVYSFSPTSFTIPPGGTQVVRICVTIQDAREKLDTMILHFNCFNAQSVELVVRGEEPVVYVADQTWKVPCADMWFNKSVVIQNGSDVDLIITSYEVNKLNDSTGHFRLVSGLTGDLPIILHAGQKYTFVVGYNSFGEGNVMHRVDVKFFSNATRVDDIAVLIGSCDTATSVTEHQSNELQIAPNPFSISANRALSLLNSTAVENVVIYNAVGEIVYQGTSSEPLNINSNVFRPGMYMVRVIAGQKETLLPLICLE